MRSRLLALSVACLAVAVAASACSGSPDRSASADPTTSSAATPTTTSPSVTPSPSPTKPAVSALSGRAGLANGPILAVKIDNTRKAHPQFGLKAADVIYVEQVEGGVTRLIAVYSSTLPKKLGPVRSARITDTGLLPQYGRIGFAYSGAQRRMLPVLANSSLYLASYDSSGRGYWRERSRPAPYNVFADGRALVRRVPKAAKPSKVGYTFGPAPAGGFRTRQVTARWPSARLDLTWSAPARRWLVAMDGVPDRAAEGGVLGGTTVVVQYVKVVPSRFRDVNGANTPNMVTVGAGPAMILRDGMAYNGRWSRPRVNAPTYFTMNGRQATFAPGQVWVLLVDVNRPVRRS